MFFTQLCFVLFFLINLVYIESASEEKKKDAIDDYDWDVWCKFQPNGADCTENGALMKPRFYYDLKMEDCKTFTYGDCPNSKNNFETLSQCHSFCRDVGFEEVKANVSAHIYCQFQRDFGRCNNYFPMWYYDVTDKTCKGFSYSGCGGNMNRFSTAQLCAVVCASTI